MTTLGFGLPILVLGLCFWLESIMPYIMEPKRRWAHDASNITLGLLNALTVSILLGALSLRTVGWADQQAWGLLHLLPVPEQGQFWLGLLLFDLWMYLWHRINHEWPLLWRFHRVHHTDDGLNATSAYRFHIGEMLLSALVRLAVIPLLGIGLVELAIYELILQPAIIFHHSNIKLKDKFDSNLRRLIVSPDMHKVHHSDIPEETNSNYGTIFSFWDRLFGTDVQRPLQGLRFGLKTFPDPTWQSILGMLKTPFLSK